MRRNPTAARFLQILGVALAVGWLGLGMVFSQDKRPQASGANGRQWITYDPPNEQQLKLELSYAEADPLSGGGGKVLWKGVKIKQFPKTGGEAEMTAETPECISDNRLTEITSSGPLTVHASNIFLEGVGFYLTQTNSDSRLVLSNEVHSILQIRPATNGPPVPATKISSHRGEFEMKSEATNGLALYLGSVRVDDPQMKLTCEWLRADLPKSEAGGAKQPNHIVAETNVVIDFAGTNGEQIHATGQRGVYDYLAANTATNETLELTGQPRVEMTNGWMTADVFVMDRAHNRLRGRDNCHFHYRKPNQPPGAPETQIASDAFDFDMNTRLVKFAGHVGANNGEMKLASEILTSTLPGQEAGKTNRLDHILAETNVVIDFLNVTNGQKIHATGQKAVYDYRVAGTTTNELLELTGNPTMELTNAWMTADVIRADRAQGRIWGEGSHHSVLKKSPGEPTTMDTEIFSDEFEFATATGLAVYRGKVRAYDPQLNLINARLLTIQLAKDDRQKTNQVRIQKIVAEGDVAMDFAPKAFATGDITNLTAFAARLRQTTAQDGVSQFVSGRLSPPTRSLLAGYAGGTNAELQKLLAEELNRLTAGGPVYEAVRFTNVYLSLETSDLMKQQPLGLDLVQLNRLLLLDAFRGELARGKTGDKTHATGDRAVYAYQGTGTATNAVLELSGHPKLVRPDGWWATAEETIIDDRTQGTTRFIGQPHFYAALKDLKKSPGAAKKAKKQP